jgi:DNA-entry nuclease
MASLVYQGEPYVVINDNNPAFNDADFTTISFESYGELDELGRCTTAFANIGKDIMPTEKRGAIGEVKPTGWQTAKYDSVDGKYLYNRCHLIGYQLTGENANEKNLITGTRYLNVDGMLPFENMVADYIKETGNHVLYRVTPVFSGDNLVASGVQMEAKSVEDNGDGILFNVYCFNAQPGIAIDYATGNSHLDNSVTESSSQAAVSDSANVQTYVLNTNTKKFHKESCNSAKSMDASNKRIYTGSRQEIIDMGYEACGVCKP